MTNGRVLVIGEVYPDSFADNVCTSLRDAGHSVRSVSPFSRVLGGGGRIRARARHDIAAAPRLAVASQRHVEDAAEEFQPDVLMNLDYRLAWPMVERLRRAAGGAPVVFWYPDAASNLGRETHVLAGYDAVFLKDSQVAARYEAMLGMRAHYLPEACNPRWHRAPDGVEPADDDPVLLVAGNLYPSRFKLLERLRDHGIAVELHGPPAPRWLTVGPRPSALAPGPYLAREAKARAFRGAFAVLNAVAVTEADGLNCRLFEAAGSGAVVLTEYRDRLPSLFAIGEEVLSFASFGELLERVEEVRAMDRDDRVALGDAAAARAHRQHTYCHRFEQILSELGRG